MEDRAKGLYFGTSKLGTKGQIVVPKFVRDLFGVAPGDPVVILADINRGIAVLPASMMEEVAHTTLEQTFSGGKAKAKPKKASEK